MCCFNEYFQSKTKLKSPSKVVCKNARLQKPKRGRYMAFSVQNAQNIKICFEDF